MQTRQIREGRTEIAVPSHDDSAAFPPGTAPVFYNPRMELNRDATILFLKAVQPENYLDTMGASGIRGFRVAEECKIPVTINDKDSRAVELIVENMNHLSHLPVEVSHDDANALMSVRRFDCVDLDPFGTPAPFVDAAAGSAKHYLCVTATDTAPLCGAHLKAGIRRYGAVPMNNEYHSEIGLRILLGFVVREIVKYDRGVEPLFCFAREHFVRLHLRLSYGADRADKTLTQIGYIYQCPSCPYRTTGHGMLPTAHHCPTCGKPLKAVGPLWLGPLQDHNLLAELSSLMPEQEFGSAQRLGRLLETLSDEIELPTFYEYHKLCKRWKISPGKSDDIIAQLREAGYLASRTHFSGTGLKTDAPLDVIETFARNKKV